MGHRSLARRSRWSLTGGIAAVLLGAVIPAARAQRPGLITTIAGTGDMATPATLGDNGPALVAQFYMPTGLVYDGAGNLYVLDGGGLRVRKIDPNGTVTTVAGGNRAGYSGDGGKAVDAMFNGIAAIAVDAAGDLYVADTYNNRVRRIGVDGRVETVAGSGEPGFLGDGGRATDAQMIRPSGVAVDASGNLYLSDTGNDRVRKVNSKGIIVTVAGSGELDVKGLSGFSGDGGPAVDAQLSAPTALAVDPKGNVYVFDSGNRRIRRIDVSGKIATVAGDGAQLTPLAEGAPATKNAIGINGISQITVDGAGNLYFGDLYWDRVFAVGADGSLRTVAGGGTFGDGRPAVNATLNGPAGVALDAMGNLLISESSGQKLREVFGAGGPGLVAGQGPAIGPLRSAIPGDVNGDGKVDIADATIVLRFTVDLATLTDAQLKLADVNQDGVVAIEDAVLILRQSIDGSAIAGVTD